MPFEVTILGTSSATPTVDRHPTSQYLVFNNRHMLLDCGEGSQKQMLRYGLRSFKVEKIFISHLHPDHYLGLPGYLSTLSLKGRLEPMHIYAPAGLRPIIEVQQQYAQMHLTFPVHYHPLPEEGDRSGILYEDAQMEISCFGLEHRMPCWGFLFREKKAPHKINKEAVEGMTLPPNAYGVLKSGKDFVAEDGTVYEAARLTVPNTPPVSYLYITDTLYLPHLADQLSIHKPSLLYHESTFLHELADKAAATHHSTALQAAEFAQRCGAQRLIIGHFSSRYKLLHPLLEEARTVFPQTWLAEEGGKFEEA